MHRAMSPVLLALLLGAGAAQAQQAESSDSNVPPQTARKQSMEVAQGGPARWDQDDVTDAQRLKTMRKEAGAALQEALGNCKRGAAAERAACVKEARATYRQEMASLPQRLAAER